MPEDIQAFLALLEEKADLIALKHETHICRDPDDDMVIETAVLGKACLIVSRDEDLTRDPAVLEYLNQAEIEVLTVQKFLERLD